LVVGYAGTVYHAWINVYITDIGWVDKVIYFDGKNWSLMDPTFVSSGKSSQSVMQYVSDGKNYSQKFAY
ncbi:MAG: transglutaminase domain-containing protein, partial [Clostridiales bacterium]|nr:transglutaminase domain-containing protein [Clostridiales bacterium]